MTALANPCDLTLCQNVVAADVAAKPPEAAPLPAFTEAMETWLASWSWELFFTGTFSQNVTSGERAWRAFRRFENDCNREIYGKRWYRHNEGLRVFVAWELQHRGAFHCHALLAQTRGCDYRFVHEAWSTALARAHDPLKGFSWIRPYKRGAARYVPKYVAKESDRRQTWDLSGPWKGSRQLRFDVGI